MIMLDSLTGILHDVVIRSQFYTAVLEDRLDSSYRRFVFLYQQFWQSTCRRALSTFSQTVTSKHE